MPEIVVTRDGTTLTSIVYRSHAVVAWSDTALSRLLAGARAHNATVGVTGVLVYDRGCFFQWIEGPFDASIAVMDRVRNDTRHRDVEILAQQPIPSRLFPGWGMTLGRRALPPDTACDGMFATEPHVLDELHLNRPRVQMVLASLSVPAWEALRPPPHAS